LTTFYLENNTPNHNYVNTISVPQPGLAKTSTKTILTRN